MAEEWGGYYRVWSVTELRDALITMFFLLPPAELHYILENSEARAIVTESPGTTRDAIEAIFDRPRWPLRLVDTAGLRDATDVLEQLGIETSARYLARATLVLVCGESMNRIDEATRRVRALTATPVLGVLTKADLVAERPQMHHAVAVSARTGEGLGLLLDAIDARLAAEHGAPPSDDAPGLTRARHRAAATTADWR